MAMSATGTASLAGFPPPSIITTQTTAYALLKAENANLIAKLAERTSRTKHNARRSSNRPSWDRNEVPKRYYQNTNYCWTHGHDIYLHHTGMSCKNKSDGHIAEATINDRRRKRKTKRRKKSTSPSPKGRRRRRKRLRSYRKKAKGPRKSTTNTLGTKPKHHFW